MHVHWFIAANVKAHAWFYGGGTGNAHGNRVDRHNTNLRLDSTTLTFVFPRHTSILDCQTALPLRRRTRQSIKVKVTSKITRNLGSLSNKFWLFRARPSQRKVLTGIPNQNWDNSNAGHESPTATAAAVCSCGGVLLFRAPRRLSCCHLPPLHLPSHKQKNNH